MFGSTSTKHLVTGATGKTGMPTVAQLCALGHAVRAVVHREDHRSAALEKLGAEIFVADLYDSVKMAQAMRGIQRASFCPPVQPFMIEAANVFAVAAHQAGVEHIVQVSQWLAHPNHPSLHTRQLWLVEQLLSMVPGATFTLINPGVFADPILQMLPTAVHLGMLPNVFVGLMNAPASNEDMGRSVAHALTAPERHAGKRYRPTGPAVLSMADIAAIMGRVIGRTVTLKDMPPEAFLKAGRAAGAPDFEITNVMHFIRESALHVFDTHAPTEDVLKLTGRKPEDFETITRRYARMPFAQPTLANKIRAFRDLARVLISRPLDMNKHDAVMEYPAPCGMQQSGHSRIWHQQHDFNIERFNFESSNTAR